MPRKLRVGFRSEASFRKEYAQNIAKGGLFIPTPHGIEIRESVEVELALSFAGQSVILPGEVVHCIPAEMAESGVQPGVAIQFMVDAGELRDKLGAFADPVVVTVDERRQGTGQRAASRTRAHVPADVEIDAAWLEGHTRNVSTSGVLVTLPGDAPAVGRRVKVRIRLPSKGERMKIPGQVARHVQASGLTSVGVQFRIPAARVGDVADFIERVRAVEHARRLGGINGPIAELGIRSVLQMFGSTAPQGMLTLSRGDEEGYIVIDHGRIRAQLGRRAGRGALDELLAWQAGSFAFEGQSDETLVSGEAIVLAEVLGGGASPSVAVAEGYQALVLHDLQGLEPRASKAASSPRPAAGPDGFVPDGEHSLRDFVLAEDEVADLEARFQSEPQPIGAEATLIATGRGDRSRVGKIEEAVLDLAAVGVTVAQLVETIPESGTRVRAAVRSLVDEGFLTFS